MTLHLTARTFAGATIIECSGRLVLGEETSDLRKLVKSTLTESKRVVLELGDVDFIDSAGVGLLARLYASAQMTGATLKLANLSPRMQDMLKITKLFLVFEIFDSAEAAAKSF